MLSAIIYGKDLSFLRKLTLNSTEGRAMMRNGVSCTITKKVHINIKLHIFTHYILNFGFPFKPTGVKEQIYFSELSITSAGNNTNYLGMAVSGFKLVIPRT